MKNKEKNQKNQKNETKQPKKRQIIIETDGQTVQVIKAEVAGPIEFAGILTSILNSLANQKK